MPATGCEVGLEPGARVGAGLVGEVRMQALSLPGALGCVLQSLSTPRPLGRQGWGSSRSGRWGCLHFSAPAPTHPTEGRELVHLLLLYAPGKGSAGSFSTSPLALRGPRAGALRGSVGTGRAVINPCPEPGEARGSSTALCPEAAPATLFITARVALPPDLQLGPSDPRD